MSKPKYVLYLVTRNATHHYPVIMSANGKPCLNEPTKRKDVLRTSMERFLDAAYNGSEQVGIVQLTEAEFRKKHPKFPVNAGPKKKAAPKAKEVTFRKGQKVTVDAGIWGKCEAVVKEQDPKFEDLYYLTITKGAHKGQTGRYQVRNITPR